MSALMAERAAERFFSRSSHAFVCQIDMHDLRHTMCARGGALPAKGILYAFANTGDLKLLFDADVSPEELAEEALDGPWLPPIILYEWALEWKDHFTLPPLRAPTCVTFADAAVEKAYRPRA